MKELSMFQCCMKKCMETGMELMQEKDHLTLKLNRVEISVNLKPENQEERRPNLMKIINSTNKGHDKIEF